jgi:hypothetical protein
MAEIEYKGIRIGGGKIFILLSLLGTLGGGAWTGFQFYQDYLDMKAKIQSYTAPDLTYLEKRNSSIEIRNRFCTSRNNYCGRCSKRFKE